MKQFAAVLAFFMLTALPGATARAQVASAEYQANWLEAQGALAAFASAQLAQGRKDLDRDDLVATYRRESERHAKALTKLGARLPPPEAALPFWKTLPLHERAQDAMKLVVTATERGDEAALTAAWLSLSEAVQALQRTVLEE